MFLDRISDNNSKDVIVYICYDREGRVMAEYVDWGDPAGANKFSKAGGGFTSNAELMSEACGIEVEPSEQNLTARIESVDQQLKRIDGILIDPSCIRLINGFLGGYCYPEIGSTGVYGDKPIKNRFSHPQDALQYRELM